MKQLNFPNQLVLFLCISVLLIQVHFKARSQSSTDIQLYNIHEDAIRPGMKSLYEETTSKLAHGLKEFDVDCNFFTVQRGDLKYLFFRPVKDLGSLKENSWGKLKPHMPERYNAISADFKKCFDTHSNYILELHHSLSHNIPAKNAARRLIYLYIAPEFQGEFLKLAKEVRELMQAKQIDIGYRVYEGGYGVPENYFMIEVFSDHVEEIVDKLDLFEEYRNKVLRLTYKLEDVNAKIRDDLSYSRRSN